MPNEKKEFPIFKALKMSGQGLDKSAYLILIGLANFAGNETGACYPSIPTLAKWSGKSQTAVREAIDELIAKGRIVVERGGGRKSNRYTINFDVTPTESVPLPDELTPTESEGLTYGIRTPDLRNSRGCPTESDPDLLKQSSRDVLCSDLSEAKAKHASADANARLSRLNQTDKDKTNNSSSSVDLSSDKSNPCPPWEQSDEDAFTAWRRSYALPYDLADFLLIKIKYGERIQDVLDGHGTLALIIKWACHVSKDFRKDLEVIESTRELREEFPHILMKITAYILAGELTPRTFIERVDEVYQANLVIAGIDLDPQDAFEEELMAYDDEYETVMTDMINPWAEEDAAEAARPGYREEQLELRYQSILMCQRAIAGFYDDKTES